MGAFSFQPGTYWIYVDSLSGRVDSFVVNSNQMTHLTTDPSNKYSTEARIIWITEYNIGPAPLVKDNITWYYELENNEMDISYSNHTNGIDLSLTPLFNYPYQPNFETLYTGYMNLSPDTPNIDFLYSSHLIRNNTFSNVECVSHLNRSVFNDRFYISPKIGLVKMELNHPQASFNVIWELERWHVVF